MTAGMPVAIAPAGTSLTTTELAPIWASSPMYDRAQHPGAGADGDAVADGRVPLDPLQACGRRA